MLRRLPLRRGPFQAIPGNRAIEADAAEPSPERLELVALAAAAAAYAEPPKAAAARGGWRPTKKRIALSVCVVLVAVLGLGYTQKDRYTDRIADTSRSMIGDENTARIEAWYFRLQDKIDRVKFKVLGGKTNPFDLNSVVFEYVPLTPARTVLVDVSIAPDTSVLTVPSFFKFKELQLPQTKPLRDKLEQGEGVWSTVGLPHTTATDIVMAKTFVRPDKARPYALVGVLVVDQRRVRLHMVGGTADPGGDVGVKGPGAIPQEHMKNLLVAWNGGFKGPHGGFGMVADGKTYRPLRNGLATVAVTKDGAIKVGEWGRSLNMEEGMVGIRQNAVLLVDNCEVSKRTAEGNDTWGYVNVNSAEFVTWRSAIGLTKDGNLVVAAGNSLSAATLANALWAAGACTAMQLDINNPYVLTSLFFPQPDGNVKAERFIDAMPDSPTRFFKTQERDFMYLTLDDARFAGYK